MILTLGFLLVSANVRSTSPVVDVRYVSLDIMILNQHTRMGVFRAIVTSEELSTEVKHVTSVVSVSVNQM